MILRAVLLAIALLLLAACEGGAVDLVAPPVDAVEVAPLPIYRAWADSTEAVVGVRVRYATLRWYLAGTDTFECRAGDRVTRCFGQYFPGAHKIVLATTRVESRNTVIHEMIHAGGIVDHCHPAFRDWALDFVRVGESATWACLWGSVVPATGGPVLAVDP